MKNLVTLTVVIVAAAATSARAQTATVCADTMSVTSCFSFQLQGGGLSLEQRELAEKPTGSVTPGNTAPTAIADFLPRLSAALLSSGVTDDLPSLNLAANLPLNDGLVYDLGLTLQAAVSLHAPEINSAILDSVAENRRPSVRERFESGFDELSDPELVLSLNAENRWFGRSYRQHAQELSVLLGEVERRLPDVHAALTALQVFLATGTPHILPERAGDHCKTVGRADANRLECYDTQFREQLEQRISTAATAYLANHAAFSTWVERSGFRTVADLINNKPQVNVTLNLRPREDVVGPSEVAVRVRGEWSPVSLNGARRYCRRVTKQPRGDLQADCLRQYVLNESARNSLRRAERIWVTAALRHTPEYDAPFLAEDTATFSLPEGWGLETAIGAGWYVSPGAEGPQRSRIDFEARSSWRRAGDIRLRPRIIASATYTLRLGETIAGVVGLTWANSPSLLDPDLTRVRANLGFRYKLAQPSQ